ncbi:HNH endonuclease (plasmid) [Clostridium butyricum]|uniref:GH-E family nuclease n=1 Tax=Clostridium butyricum TaxID=1492 RepID=UPI0013D85F78|nr:GH-E family nuclease [Clostridium butyricum]NFB73524.1 HNH endonuclease [Clostridium butyricum]NFB92912.1 HNH endonuclease [Clostridium butyricum]UTY55671.1 HNH endonuclease [Clostridium butyricum]
MGKAGNKQLVNGPYIKNGKPNGRPAASGKKKLQFEKDVYNDNVDLDGILRDPNTGEVIEWKPGQPRREVVDFGHKSGYSYKEMFNKYKNGDITLNELKDFQTNPDNYRLETPSANRSHKFE